MYRVYYNWCGITEPDQTIDIKTDNIKNWIETETKKHPQLIVKKYERI
jgi:hypothetical protein